jgi:cytochrome c-type biogenesis protein
MGGLESIGAVGAAFAAGMLSFLSPCVMPLMPAYLSLISGLSVEEMQEVQEEDGSLRRRVMTACLGFVAGFSTVFIVLGASATWVGRTLRTWHTEVFGIEFGIAQIAGVVIIVMGLHIAGLLPVHLFYREARIQVRGKQRSLVGTYLVGAAFAFGWSPCVGPILSGILTVAASRETVLQGVALLAVYSAGLAVPFLLTGWSLEYFFRFFDRVKRHFRTLEVVSGTLLVAIGVLVVTDQLTRLNNYFVFLNRVVATLEETLL